MQKQNILKNRRARNLVVVSALMAVILTVSTYAWFIGMQTVNVTSFDVEIKTTDSLLLSLDGSNWSNEVSINKDNFKTISYTGNTNSWSKLIPMSTIGEMDSGTSRMKLYEKASFTATRGGYRLMASQVDNSTTTVPEPEGYVAFDLFVHNMSGAYYNPTLNPLDEEAIYLTVDSGAKIAVAGSGGVANTGIENSVRLAFTQIGRVVGTTTPGSDAITKLTCNDTTLDGVATTGICRDAQIWEPNDRNHVQAAIDYYDTACRARTGLDVTDPSSYSPDKNSCQEIKNGTTYPTYVVSEPIASANNIDVYDGTEYNGYLESSREPATSFLENHATFTDTMKMTPGRDRQAFMYLEPNSITKVRVYIYIEGQDVDNYDFAQIGKMISINFGFTKQQLNADDFGYTQPYLNPEAPVITLTGENPATITKGTPYADLGFSVTDDSCAELGDPEKAACETALHDATIVNTSAVNENVVGKYMVTYNVKDSDGNQTIRSRTVNVTE